MLFRAGHNPKWVFYREDECFRQVHARQKELLVAGMEIRESIVLDYDYKYGVGLYLLLNIPSFDLAGLKLAMARFFDRSFAASLPYLCITC